MRKGRLGGVLVTAVATVAFALPAAPVGAAGMTCHPPRYDTVECACHAAMAAWELITGGTQLECHSS